MIQPIYTLTLQANIFESMTLQISRLVEISDGQNLLDFENLCMKLPNFILHYGPWKIYT